MTLETELKTYGIKLDRDDIAWVEKRLAEGRHMDFGDVIRDLVRRDQEGLLPDRRTMPE